MLYKFRFAGGQVVFSAAVPEDKDIPAIATEDIGRVAAEIMLHPTKFHCNVIRTNVLHLRATFIEALHSSQLLIPN